MASELTARPARRPSPVLAVFCDGPLAGHRRWHNAAFQNLQMRYRDMYGNESLWPYELATTIDGVLYYKMTRVDKSQPEQLQQAPGTP